MLAWSKQNGRGLGLLADRPGDKFGGPPHDDTSWLRVRAYVLDRHGPPEVVAYGGAYRLVSLENLMSDPVGIDVAPPRAAR